MNTPLRLLLVEDSDDDAFLIETELRRGGYDVHSRRVMTAEGLNAALASESWDIIIADYNLPQFSCLEALKVVQAFGADIPLITMSGTVDERLALETLRAGAHDYVMKTNMTRLVAAVARELGEVVIRRQHWAAEDEVVKRNRELRILHEIAKIGLQTTTLDRALQLIADAVSGSTDYPCVSIELYDESRGMMMCRGAVGFNPPEPSGEIPVDDTLSGQAAKTGEPLVLNDARREASEVGAFTQSLAIASLLAVPMVANNRVLGVLSFFGQEPVAADERQLQWATVLANYIASFAERKRGEEMIRLLGSAVEQANEAVMITTTTSVFSNARIEFVNSAFAKMTGYAPADVVGETVGMFLGPKSDPAEMRRLDELLEEGSEYFGDMVSYRRDNTEFFVEWRITPVGDERGQPTHFVSVMRDVTDRKLSEEKIRDQASLLDLAQDAIYVRSLSGGIQFWNKGAERLYGWTAEEVLGRGIDEEMVPDTNAVDVAQAAVLAAGKWSGEQKHVNRAGDEVAVNSRWTLVRDGRGEPKSILVINTDVTDKKRLEAQFLRAQRMESIGTLASGIAHDLNNILSPILMSVTMLRWGMKPEETKQALDTIEASARRGADIIKQVLTFGRGVEGDKALLTPTKIVDEIVRIVSETFPRSVSIKSSMDRDLWPVLGDATQLHQVFLNLCVNARDALPEGRGSIQIHARNVSIDENYAGMRRDLKVGPYVQFLVIDDGEGIPPEIVDKIFDPFFTTKELGKGTGLGLSTVVGIVKGHDGFVTVRSELGKGSEFDIFLPATPEDQVVYLDDEPSETPRGNGELVLLVDDEANIRDALRRSLEQAGYAVLAAEDGPEALILFTKNRRNIRLVITDIMMPVMDGVALVRALKKLDADVPVIVTSGLLEQKNNPTKMAELNELGIEQFLPKPYTASRLLVSVRQVLGAKPSVS